MLAYLWVAFGGALGSVARYACNGFVTAKLGPLFPWGTLLINVMGSLAIGIAYGVVFAQPRMDSSTRAFAVQFVMVGLCGGFTTFSAFSLQTLELIQNGQWLRAGVNIIGSVGLCLVAVWLGQILGTSLNSVKGSQFRQERDVFRATLFAPA